MVTMGMVRSAGAAAVGTAALGGSVKLMHDAATSDADTKIRGGTAVTSLAAFVLGTGALGAGATSMMNGPSRAWPVIVGGALTAAVGGFYLGLHD